jgi:hypothetical protein
MYMIPGIEGSECSSARQRKVRVLLRPAHDPAYGTKERKAVAAIIQWSRVVVIIVVVVSRVGVMNGGSEW